MNRYGNQKTIGKKLGIWPTIGIVILLLAVMAPLVSADSYKIYASGKADYLGSDGKIHKILTYQIPHKALPYKTSENGDPCGSTLCYKPYVGGTDPAILSVMVNDKDPQNWEYAYRRQINNDWDVTALMIPTTYVVLNQANWWTYNLAPYDKTIYLTNIVYRR